MRNKTNSTTRSMTATIAVGILLVTLSAPAFAGSGSTTAQFAGGSFMKNISVTPTQVVEVQKAKGHPRSTWTQRTSGIGSLKGGVQNVVMCLPIIGPILGGIIVGMSDDPMPL